MQSALLYPAAVVVTHALGVDEIAELTQDTQRFAVGVLALARAELVWLQKDPRFGRVDSGVADDGEMMIQAAVVFAFVFDVKHVYPQKVSGDADDTKDRLKTEP